MASARSQPARRPLVRPTPQRLDGAECARRARPLRGLTRVGDGMPNHIRGPTTADLGLRCAVHGLSRARIPVGTAQEPPLVAVGAPVVNLPFFVNGFCGCFVGTRAEAGGPSLAWQVGVPGVSPDLGQAVRRGTARSGSVFVDWFLPNPQVFSETRQRVVRGIAESMALPWTMPLVVTGSVDSRTAMSRSATRTSGQRWTAFFTSVAAAFPARRAHTRVEERRW
jgi:hypothetical protein